jgi:hypothetical protein
MNKIQICSVAPEEFRVARPTYNCFVTIPAAKPDSYSFTWVTDHEDTKRFYQDLKTIEYVPFPISAQEIVNDLFKSEQLEEKGCFVAKGDKPTADELSDARGKRTEYLLRCAMEGDKLYSQFGDRGIQFVPDYFKRAVSELGETRPWVFRRAANKTQCGGCGTMVPTLADGTLPAVCMNCKAPINKQLAIELGLWTPPAQPIKRRGRKPKAVEEAVSQ